MALLARTLSDTGGEILTAEALYERFVPPLRRPVRELLRSTTCRVPGEAALRRVASRFRHAMSPAGVFKTAGCLDLLDVLAGAGWTPRERFELMLEVRAGRPGGHHPTRAALILAAADLSVDDGRALVAAHSDDRDPFVPLICALPLVRAGEPPPPQLEEAPLVRLPPETLRELLDAAPAARREAALLRLMAVDDANAARFALERLMFSKDLLTSPPLAEALVRLREVASDYPGVTKIFARFDGPTPVRERDGLTALAREPLDYIAELWAQARKQAGLYAVAEHATRQRVDIPGATELLSLEAWAAAPQERRDAIAELVLDAIGRKAFRRTGFHGDIALFVHRRKKAIQLALVPGGEVERGLSDAEEERLRTLAAAAGLTGSVEEWGTLVEQLPLMRPAGRVTVGPMLIGRGPGERMGPRKLVRWLTSGPYRLPTEAEWEYAARGGRARELTWRGDVLPDTAWFEEGRELGEDAANRFGLWGFGDRAEICADRWRPSLEGAPSDGSPVTGAGPRAVRGGAGELFPWQETGEWHLLLSAMRTSQEGVDEPAARPVIGLRVVDALANDP